MIDDTHLAATIAASGLAGAVALLGDRDGVTYCRAFGLRNSATGAAMTTDTVFQIASMTKAIVSVAALQLVERGRLALDAPIVDTVPDFGAPMVITGFDADDQPLLRPAARPVTLRHLLTHTSGLGYDFISAMQLKARRVDAPAAGTRAALHTHLLFDPGERWEYGIGTDWVGLMIEAVSGQSLDAYLAEHVLAPVGMADTGFLSTPTMPDNGAAVHVRLPGGAGLTPVPVHIGDGDYLSGGGGLSSTGGDYMRFIRMILNGGILDGVRVLSADMVAALCMNQVGALPAGRMDSAMPEFAPPYDPFPGMDCGWGLGFLINPVPGPHGRAPGSLAWAGIFNTYYWIDPVNGVAGVFLAQLMPFADPGALAAAAALERMAYAPR